METEQTNPRLPTGALGQTRIAGRYELIAILGTGGTGVVYRARDLELSEDVAIKILPPVKAGESDIGRLKREILAARKITHPNVIRLHDFGLSDREGYISMEILPGGSLADRIARGSIPLDEALRIGIGVSEGLAAAHAEGIIHRDVKPQNILFDKAGRPKIVDFGLARGTEVTSNTVGFSGTPQYMSPESAEGGEITFKSDVYSLGVMLFEVFTGRRPFLAPSLGRLVVMHTKEAPPSPRSIRPEIPLDVEAVLLRALEKDPARRTDGGVEIAAALRRVQGKVAPLDAAAEARSLAAAGIVAPRVQGEPAPLTLVRGRLPGPPRSRLALLGFSTAALVAVAGTGLLVITKPWVTAAVPTPVPTPLALPTLQATGSLLTPAPSPISTPTAVAAATRVAVRATPKPAVSKKPGTFMVKSTGTWVKVVVDGRLVDESTPMPAAVPLSAGFHQVILTNDAKTVMFSKEITIEVKPGRLLTVFAEPLAGRVRVE